MSFADWLQDPTAPRIFLVELTAKAVASGALTVLYLSTSPFYGNGFQYISCVAEIPSIDRQFADITNPSYIPTYGDLVINLEPTFKPDQERTAAWNLLLLKDHYTFQGQSVRIRLGGEGMAENEFQTIFTGCAGDCKWTDHTLEVTLFDKLKQLDTQIPNFDLPESAYINEESWAATLPLPLGYVKHYAPIYLQALPSGVKYALSGGVIESLEALYLNDTVIDPMFYTFIQKDVSAAAKDADGSFVLETYGPYTGGAAVQEWLVQIDDVAAGTEVGQATFRWSLDGGATWEAEGVPTAKMAYSPATMTKDPDLGGDVGVIVAGDYTGTQARIYKIKCTRGGTLGTPPYPQFSWSDDNGATWSADIDIDGTGPYALSYGLTVDFTDLAVNITIERTEGACTPHGLVGASSTGSGTVRLEILQDGVIGLDDISFRWTNNGGADWNTGVIFANLNNREVVLFGDFTVNFWGNYDCFNEDDAYDIEASAAGDTMVEDEIWTFAANLQVPIPLADGVAVQFFSREGQDFYANDEARFILYSTVDAYISISEPQTGSILVNVKGLVDAGGTYVDSAGQIMQALAELFAGWSADDFDLDAMSAFAAAMPYEVGLLVKSPTSITEIFNTLLMGMPAVYSTSMAGKFFVKELAAPIGTPVITLTDADLFEYPEGSVRLDTAVCKRVLLKFDKNNEVSRNFPWPVSQAYIEWAKQEFRQVSRRDERIRDMYPLARDFGPLETCLVNRDEAMELAEKFFSLFKTPRDFLDAVTAITGFVVNLGDVAAVQRGAFGLEAGELFVVVGADNDCQKGECRLTLWR